MGQTAAHRYQSFCFLPIFDPRHPSAEKASASSGTHFPAMHLASWEFHPSEDRSEPPSFATTVLSRSALGLDGSIIVASACHRLRYRCAAPPELEDTNRLSARIFDHMACRFSAGSRGKVKNALYYSIFKEQQRWYI